VKGSGLILVGLTLAFIAAGCGGGGGGSSEKSTQRGGGTTGEAILQKAGLEPCTKHTITGAAWVGTGLVQAQQLVVAPDCDKAPKIPTTVSAYTFNTQETAKSSAKGAKEAEANAVVFVPTVAPYTTTVLVVSGPNQKEYAKDIQEALPGGS
jgi:hypothetical protein